MLSKEDKELLELVYEDLIYIKEQSGADSTDHQLRRLSVQLRNLLIEGRLIHAWKLLPPLTGHPNIIAPKLPSFRFMDESVLAVAGGGDIEGMEIGSFFLVERSLSDDEVATVNEQMNSTSEHQFKLSDFMDSHALIIKGKKINRRQVISYVANKKGGAHLDRNRKKDEEAYKIMDEECGFVFGGTREPSTDKLAGGKNHVFLSLLAIAQSLVKSPDIINFVKECKSALEG